MHRMCAPAIACAITLAIACTAAAQTGGFIFSGDQAVSAADQRQFIRVGERISMRDLKQRFSSYSVGKLSGDCGGSCFSVEGRDGGTLVIDYRGQGKSGFYRIQSSAPGSRDTLGNTIGIPLRQALGANTAHCDEGESTTCQSPRLKGLSYVVGGCDFKGSSIPACATLDGFQILR
jgi:hypothetical protein